VPKRGLVRVPYEGVNRGEGVKLELMTLNHKGIQMKIKKKSERNNRLLDGHRIYGVGGGVLSNTHNQTSSPQNNPVRVF